MGELSFHMLQSCQRCESKRLCGLLREETKRVAAEMQALDTTMKGSNLPDAVITIDCASFWPATRKCR